MPPTICLSFDVEEFDMPLEYGQQITLQEQMEVGKAGLDVLLPVLNEEAVACTMFTTANFADHYAATIKAMAQVHEIASHTYYHSHFDVKDLLQSRIRLQQISEQAVNGLRMPRMRKVEMTDVKAAGYTYDSSINPTYIPGRYNNLHISRTIYSENEMLRVPASVSPQFRIPLFWLAFKNLPYTVFKHLLQRVLKKDGYACLYFHPWEFINISNYKIPGYAKKDCDKILLEKLQRLIKDFKPVAKFETIEKYVTTFKIL